MQFATAGRKLSRSLLTGSQNRAGSKWKAASLTPGQIHPGAAATFAIRPAREGKVGENCTERAASHLVAAAVDRKPGLHRPTLRPVSPRQLPEPRPALRG